jgi:undecaprenyl-diphosphatase
VTLAARLLALDEAGARALNELTRRTPGGQRIAQTAAGTLAGGEVLLMGWLAVRGHRQAALRMLLAVGAIYAASEAIGLAIARQRPFVRLNEVQELLSHHPARSFPSRHVASAVAMASVARPVDPRIASLMGSLAAVLAVSRVAAGLHYPSDVLGGLVLGLLIARASRI